MKILDAKGNELNVGDVVYAVNLNGDTKEKFIGMSFTVVDFVGTEPLEQLFFGFGPITVCLDCGDGKTYRGMPHQIVKVPGKRIDHEVADEEFIQNFMKMINVEPVGANA